MDAYIGTVQSFAFQFAPRGWMKCQGQRLSIAQQTALFSLIGTTYGGDGNTTFGLPHLAGRTILGEGHIQGGSGVYSVGEEAGMEQVTLQDVQMPRHTHGLVTTDAPAETATPAPGLLLARASDSGGNDVNIYAPRDKGNRGPLAPDSIGLSGMSQPLSLMQPYMVMNYCICLSGNFPSRN
ncbi:MAG: phage tail protein [Caulobacteraceae bacterium]|nr:MAG: phage tail protein [Caulobacteraceae bacterium]